jgi:hypothetical protein
MHISFNDRFYQNRYSLKPVNEIDKQYLGELKTLCKKVLSKIEGNRRKK